MFMFCSKQNKFITALYIHIQYLLQKLIEDGFLVFGYVGNDYSGCSRDLSIDSCTFFEQGVVILF